MADENLPVEVASPPSPTAPAAFPDSSHVSSLSQSPVFKSLNHGASGCVTCGQGADGRLLHRLKHEGAVRHHCSSCILFYNKGMYCSQCFQVYRDAGQLGDPALWLTCCKCLRLSHLGCVRKRLCSSDSLDFSFFTCQECCSPSIRGESPTSQLMEGLCASICAEGRDMPYMASPEGLPSHKNLPSDVEEESVFADPAVIVPGDVAACCSPEPARHSSGAFQDLSFQDQEAVAAANIVAALAANEAKEAKIRARATATTAVKAAARAKAALDAAYRAAREEAKRKVEASRNFPAIAGQPTAQVMVGGTQSGGVNASEKRKLEAVVGNDDHSGQSMRIPANQEDLGRNPKTVTYAPRSPRSGVASYKRRTLSAIAASEATRAHPSSSMVSQHRAVLFKPQQPRRGSPKRGDVADLRLHGSLGSVQEVTDQIRDDPEHGLNEGPFVLANRLGVNASPASISESCSTLMGIPRPDAVAGISETGASLLPGNDSLGHSHVPISGNGLVLNEGDLAADVSELLPLPITGNPVTGMCGADGKLTNQPVSKELGAFSPALDEAVTDDLVDLGALIPGECEREVKLSNGCVPIEGDPASLGISAENALVTENTSAALSKPETDAGLGAITPTALTMCSEQSTGSQMAGELGKQAYEENALLANTPFMEKIQRPIVLHMPVSNHGEKPMPYSVVKASVSTTCSAPLQTTALTSVPTGHHL